MSMEPNSVEKRSASQVAAAVDADEAAEHARACASEASLDLVEQLLEAYFMQVHLPTMAAPQHGTF